MQNADELWLESCGILDISAASQAPGHNRDTPCTSPGFDIRASCLWGSEIDAVRPPPVLYSHNPRVTNPGVVVSGACTFRPGPLAVGPERKVEVLARPAIV